jgi:hypothetical protein
MLSCTWHVLWIGIIKWIQVVCKCEMVSWKYIFCSLCKEWYFRHTTEGPLSFQVLFMGTCILCNVVKSLSYLLLLCVSIRSIRIKIRTWTSFMFMCILWQSLVSMWAVYCCQLDKPHQASVRFCDVINLTYNLVKFRTWWKCKIRLIGHNP